MSSAAVETARAEFEAAQRHVGLARDRAVLAQRALEAAIKEESGVRIGMIVCASDGRRYCVASVHVHYESWITLTGYRMLKNGAASVMRNDLGSHWTIDPDQTGAELVEEK